MQHPAQRRWSTRRSAAWSTPRNAVSERLAWLPVFAIVLAGLWLAFRRVER